MNILVIGSGGREHAICYAFAKSSRVSKIYCAPGNAGIAEIAEGVPLNAEDIGALAGFATAGSIDLTFVGGESPLALGIADEFEARGLKIIGASAKAARLEASKAFAKDFMKRHGVPTAEYSVAKSAEEAVSLLESGTFGDPDSPVVVKADGLAAGKGVIVAGNRVEAVSAINGLADTVGSDAASVIVLEECMFGREVSLIMFADGEDFALMPPTRDHKRIGEGDTGPNTGGMGTFTEGSLLTEDQTTEIVENIIRPTLRGCIEEGFPFRGILFLGLMMTECRSPRVIKGVIGTTEHHDLAHDRGFASETTPKLLEYNVRFGDPETQSILVRLETDLINICDAMLEGRLKDIEITWIPGNSATVVLSSEGYPQAPKKGDVITGIEQASALPKLNIFHSGTAQNENGEMVTAGGRVLGVTATGDTLRSALDAAYTAVGKVSWKGMQFRRDIGR